MKDLEDRTTQSQISCASFEALFALTICRCLSLRVPRSHVCGDWSFGVGRLIGEQPHFVSPTFHQRVQDTLSYEIVYLLFQIFTLRLFLSRNELKRTPRHEVRSIQFSLVTESCA